MHAGSKMSWVDFEWNESRSIKQGVALNQPDPIMHHTFHVCGVIWNKTIMCETHLLIITLDCIISESHDESQLLP